MIGFVVWSMLLVLVAFIWASRHLAVNEGKRINVPLCSGSYPGPPEHPPKVSVLIAARNEEANVERAVRSMLRQDYPDFELIVINDRSTDRTPDVLESLRAEQSAGRLRVVHVQQLRDGWFGKNNAMREGVALAAGEWLCFGDADCNQTSPRALSMAVRHAVERGVDFLSILPRMENQSLWEKILQPVCGGIMMFWFNPKRVNDPDHPAAYANGAYMLMTRRCYDAIGGHDAVKAEVNEDMHMARLAKQRRRRLLVVNNQDLYTVRMYSNLRQIWRGWSRIFYGCFGTFRQLRLSMFTLTLTTVFPYVSALVSGGVLLARGGSETGWGWPAVAGLAALCIVLQQTVLVRFYRLIGITPWLAPTFFIGAVVCIGMLASAMLKLAGRTRMTWRGDDVSRQAGGPSALVKP